MRLDVDVSMEYQLGGDERVLLTLEAAETDGQSVLESALDAGDTAPHVLAEEGMVGTRAWAFVAGDRFSLRYRASVEVTRPEIALDALSAAPFHRLPSQVLRYLRPSRFCQSDLFTSFVARQFGPLEGGAKIAAIAAWVAEEMVYSPGASNAGTTAMDSFVAREGVCRDYTHLVCALARAAHIPARYTSVYGPRVQPADFHAVAEVWLDGAWHFVDGTGMSSASELVVIASGRDAADVAFMETESWAQLIAQTVTVSEIA
jgi:transglutaminase-like putative cysteine protease